MGEGTDRRELLEQHVERLEQLYDRKREQLRRDFPHEFLEPEDITDPNGRPILLDALVAIVNARSALIGGGP